MTNRRTFLRNASLLTASSLVGTNLMASNISKSDASATANKALGLQTYSLGGELSADVPGGFAKLAKMGYVNLELAGYRDGKIGNYGMAEYKKMAKDAGLNIVSSHLSPSIREYKKENFAQFDEFWKKAADDHVTLGTKFMVQPSMPSVSSHDDAKVVCEVFNRAGEIAKKAGLSWGYHNHSGEFARIVSAEQKAAQPAQGRRGPQGDYVETLFIEGTDPNLVFFQLDVYWAVMGQQDPCEWMDKYPDRFKLLHIKDRWIIGASGMMNFENIFNKGYAIGMLGYYVEIEGGGDGRTQFEAAEESAKFLNKAPYVK